MATAKVKTVDWRAAWETQLSDTCQTAWTSMMRNPARHYLYYTRADGSTRGEFHIVRDGETAPAGAEQVTAEAMPLTDVAGIRRWLGRFSGQLPMLPASEVAR